jgi:hypothetical protein
MIEKAIKKTRRFIPERHRIRLAKGCYRVSGNLSRLPWYGRLYPALTAEEAGSPWKLGKAEWEWRKHGWASVPVLEWSMYLDPVHWDHWALDHSGCETTACTVCSGRIDMRR